MDLAAFRDALEVEAAIGYYENIWRGRIVWKHMLANATVATSPYYAVVRGGGGGAAADGDAIRAVIQAKWERAGTPLDIASGISADDPQLAKYIEVELLYDAG